jgi:hypothetical protein
MEEMVGVSIKWHPVPVDPKTHDITPGARSMMHQMLLDAGLYGRLDASALPILTELAADSTGDVQASLNKLRAAITKHGAIEVSYEF